MLTLTKYVWGNNGVLNEGIKRGEGLSECVLLTSAQPCQRTPVSQTHRKGKTFPHIGVAPRDGKSFHLLEVNAVGVCRVAAAASSSRMTANQWNLLLRLAIPFFSAAANKGAKCLGCGGGWYRAIREITAHKVPVFLYA